MTAPNGRANGFAFDNPRELVVPTIEPPAAVSPSNFAQFSTNQINELPREAVRTVQAPRCGFADNRYPYPCGEPATATDIETGCTFCLSHLRGVIL